MSWKFWQKKPANVVNVTVANPVDSIIGPTRAQAQQETKWWQELRLLRTAIENTNPGYDAMARRDDRYRTLLLKEIAMQLAYLHNSPGGIGSLENRLRNAEIAIYSQPLPDWNTYNE